LRACTRNDFLAYDGQLPKEVVMDRRLFLKKTGLAGVGLAATPLLRVSAADALTTRAAVTDAATSPQATAHCLWGAYAQPAPGNEVTTSLYSLERRVGRHFAIHRDYQGMDSDILGKDVLELTDRGTTCYRSFHSWVGSSTGKRNFIPWAKIASGLQDEWLAAQALAIKRWGKPIYLAFHHEPEVWPQCGTAADFKAAYLRVHKIFAGATNVTWLVTLLSPTYNGNNGGPAAWFPPPDKYDIVGVDGYNRWPCRGKALTTFFYKFEKARYFSAQLGKPMAIGEWGSVEYNSCGNNGGDPNGKAKWLAAAEARIKHWPRLLWVSYSHVVSGKYNFRVDTSASALNQFIAMGHDRYFS
jgi:hypothetical protein